MVATLKRGNLAKTSNQKVDVSANGYVCPFSVRIQMKSCFAVKGNLRMYTDVLMIEKKWWS